MEKSGNKEDSLGTNLENRQIACNIEGCKNKAPFQCFEAMIDILKETKHMPNIFFRNSCIMEKCSRCKGEPKNDGFKTILACSHALCENCLEEISHKMTERFYQCEGDNGRCKYHVPGSIITNVLEDMKPQMQEYDDSNQSKRSFSSTVSEHTKKDNTHAVAGKQTPFHDTLVKKTKEVSLAATVAPGQFLGLTMGSSFDAHVSGMEKQTRKCEICDNGLVIALLQGCNHCFCECCLKALIESSKDAEDSEMTIDCPSRKCPSFVAVKMVEEFLSDRENSQKPHSGTPKNVNQLSLTLEKPEGAAQNEQTLTKPDAASTKRKCETEEKTDKTKMVL
eukprot:XP_019928136.1 PREDICTED: uncharacterized protein LOC105341556 [Crassostrea gigas]